ncbi:hypothetical protein MRX96_026669 [Rhipicephalus microplus]
MVSHSSRTWHGLRLVASLLVTTLMVVLFFSETVAAGRVVHPYPHLSRRGRELEYFPGVGLVEPLGLLAVASLPLFVLFSVMWLVLPLWFKFHHFGLYGHGLVPGVLPGAATTGGASSWEATEKRPGFRAERWRESHRGSRPCSQGPARGTREILLVL